MFKEQTNTKYTEPWYSMPCKAGEVYSPGEALTLSNGAVTKCSGAVKPEYICQSGKTGVSGGTVQCSKVNNGQELEAPLSAAGTALKVGDKVTIDADGLGVTATTTSGVFQITRINGTAVGDTVCGYFN